MFQPCADWSDACLTLTAIHPDGQHPTPSRHLPLTDSTAIAAALSDLDHANQQGWGAYFAPALRRPDLTRWQRGGLSDVLALPALFADVDDPSPTVLARLSACDPPPSCLVMSGGGYHAYWWLNEPLTDWTRARHLLRGLAAHVGGDRTSPAQSLRLVNSVNTKPTRAGAVCHLLTLTDRRYPASTFDRFCQPPKLLIVADSPSRDLIAAVTQHLVGRGCRQRGDWLNGPCPFPERHTHGDARPSFGFNLTSGCGHCFRCGPLNLSELASVLLARKENS